MSSEPIVKKQIRWTPRLIRRLRGKRSQAHFGTLVNATSNTIWRWEDGRCEPDEQHSLLLSDLAARERFLADWKVGGSGALLLDLDSASRKLRDEFRKTLGRRSRALRE